MAIPAYYSLIQRGSTGPDVALVQTWLNGLRDTCTWYHELTIDGRFGTKSVNAVKEFQLKNKMNVDGKVGANTWNVLYTRYTAKHGLHVPYPGIALRSGSSGGTVRLVQQKLNSLGERLNADGRYGAATAAAVQRFQRRSLPRCRSERCAKRKMPVFAISGNHDSADRVAFGAALLETSRVYVSPVFSGAPQPICLADEHGPVDVYLLPFLKPASVRHVWPDEPIESYNDALACVLRHCTPDPGHRSVLVAHQFVAGAAACESEEPSVGGVDSVDAALFDAFDYVALGHLHSPQKVGRETLRYCGTPLKYSFSEVGQQKSATFVELGAKGEVHITAAPLTPRHDLRGLRGSYMELTDRRNYEGTAVDDYLHITLTDEQDVPDALARLRVIYPNLMRLDYDNQRTRQQQEICAPERTESVSPLEHLAAFYQLQNNQPLTAEQTAFCQALIEEIWKEGDTV
mgnify:CR=1 FL=1